MKTDAEMIELALEYFPEYSERIKNPVRANNRTSQTTLESDTLVINEMRNVSDDEQIVYQEYASGPATATYTATFGFNSGSFFEGQVMNCSLVIEVGGNECTLTAY